LKTFSDKYLHWVILSILGILLITLSFLSEGYYGGADNIYHYYFSRFLFKYPHYLFDLWGRPLFTGLSSPFSQFGFQGIKIFNILAGLLTCYISYLLARKLKLAPAVLVMIFICFIPLYCSMLLTGLTEILFGLVLMLAIWYFYEEKYILSSVIISFLLFARNEGFILLPVFFLAFLLKRKLKAIPFLATGFVFFSILGSFYYKDLLWFIHHFPYSVHNPSYYSSGSFFNFFTYHYRILGTPVEVLAGIGILYLFSRFFSRDPGKRKEAFYECLMILVPLVIFVIFHSVLYWKGLGGSLGLERVIAGVMPLVAMLAIRGYSLVHKSLPDPWMKTIIFIVCVVLVARTNFRTYAYPVPLDPEEKVEKHASSWFSKSQFAQHKLYYTNFNACFFIDTQPYKDLHDYDKFGQIHSLRELKEVIPGSVVQWDAHFGANECGVPKDSIMRDPHLRLLNYFKPDVPAYTLGGYLYEVLFFSVSAKEVNADNYAVMDSLRREKEKLFYEKPLTGYDFETWKEGIDSTKISDESAHSGSRSFHIDSNTEFSPLIILKCSDISSLKNNISIRPSAWVRITDSLGSGLVYFVVSLEEQYKSYQYEALKLNSLDLNLNEWTKISFTAALREIKHGDDIIKVYIWNPGKKDLFLDDFTVEALIPKDPGEN
jgi:hypothetical protein